MNYIEARHAHEFAERYREDARQYREMWLARQPNVSYRREAATTDDEAALATSLNERNTRMKYLCSVMGVAINYGYGSRTMMAGVTGNFVDEFTDADHGPTENAVAALDKCCGALREERRRSKVRLLSPWHLAVDVLGIVVRLPFLVLRAAGMPAETERSAWASYVKIAEVAFLCLIATAFGVKVVLSL